MLDQSKNEKKVEELRAFNDHFYKEFYMLERVLCVIIFVLSFLIKSQVRSMFSIEMLLSLCKAIISYRIAIVVLQYQSLIGTLFSFKQRLFWIIILVFLNVTYWGMPAFTTLKNTPGEMKIVYKMIKYCLTGKKEDAASVGNQNV